jgi:hypothetical protein
MGKFLLHVRNNEEKFEEILRVRLRFSSMHVEFHWKNCSKFMEIAEVHGNQVKRLSLSGSKFEDLKKFSIFLGKFLKLQELKIDGIEFVGSKSQEFDSVSLKNLNHLTLKFIADFKFLRCFIATNLKSFSGAAARMTLITGQGEVLAFLETSANLSSLDIDHILLTAIFNDKASRNLQLKLRSFSSFTHDGITVEVKENLETFLKLQASSLEEFSWRYLPESVLKLLLTTTKSLKTLKLNKQSLPDEKAFYETLPKVESLRSLETEEMSREAFGLLLKFPNLENLKISADSNTLRFISIANPKLKSLTIREFNSKVSTKAKFEFLELFCIEISREDSETIAFLENHRTLKSFELKSFCVTHPTDFIFSALLRMENLKKIIVHSQLVKIQEISEVIRSNLKSSGCFDMVVTKNVANSMHRLKLRRK